MLHAYKQILREYNNLILSQADKGVEISQHQASLSICPWKFHITSCIHTYYTQICCFHFMHDKRKEGKNFPHTTCLVKLYNMYLVLSYIMSVEQRDSKFNLVSSSSLSSSSNITRHANGLSHQKQLRMK